tara:strand:- start:14795 stop:15109 length:315 start_codon:yes stop_codon:yes gene_type:complete
MNLPNVIADLTKAQNSFDSTAYSNCFTETAIVFDEGKTHKGKKEIRKWIEKSNKTYKTEMKPIEFSAAENILTAKISGTFPGSPLTLSYRFEFKDGQIQSLEII